MSVKKVSNDFDICIGVITSVNGVRGNVKIKNFTENPRDIADFKNIYDQDNKPYKISIVSVRKDCLIAEIEGISNRNEAETLRNIKLFINRSELPEASNDEYYHADLLGLNARYDDGTMVGTVKNIVNFGAGDIIEIYDVSTERTLYIPFTKAQVPFVSLIEGYITVAQQEELLAANDL
jgi:16S rRNA processing protein RimM